MQAPQHGAFSLFFKTRFCRIWLADTWHIGMSRKGTCILSYQFPFFPGRNGQALRRAESEFAGSEPPRETAPLARQDLRIIRRFADNSLLDPWHFSTLFIHGWVLCYPDAFGVGNDRASPVYKRITGMPNRLSPSVGFLNEKRKKHTIQQLTAGWHSFTRKSLNLYSCRYSQNAGHYS